MFFILDADGAPGDAFKRSVDLAFFHFLDLLLAFLCCAQSIAEEVEARTVGYVLVRPAPRGAIVLGKLAAGYGHAMAVLTLCFAAIAIGGATVAEDVSAYLALVGRGYGAVALHTLTVSTVCLACGAIMPEAAGVLAILYIGGVEFAMSFAPFLFRLLSSVHHASVLTGIEPSASFHVPVVPPTAAGLVLVMITLFALVLAMFVVGKREYRYASA